jgi:hypothetical protein
LNSPELEQDRQGSDYFFELYGQLEQFQTMLLPQTTPNWSEYDMGLSALLGLGINSLYYDFFTVGDTKKVIIVSEAPSRGAEGILLLSMLRTIVHLLIQEYSQNKTPKKIFSLASFFRELLVNIEQHIYKRQFAISLLMINSQLTSYEYCTTGYGLLVQMSQNGSTSIINENKTDGNYTKHDRFLLVGCHKNEEFFEKVCKETLNVSPQKQVDTILRKLQLSHLIDDQPLLLFSIGNLVPGTTKGINNDQNSQCIYQPTTTTSR